MKKASLIIILLLNVSSSIAQINDYAKYLINFYNVDFELTVKRHALEEYRTDDPMFLNEINDQSESIFRIVEIYNFENKDVLYDAIIDWSYDEFEEKNKEIFNSQNKVNVENLLKLHCDWEEVLYELNKFIRKKKKDRKKGIGL